MFPHLSPPFHSYYRCLGQPCSTLLAITYLNLCLQFPLCILHIPTRSLLLKYFWQSQPLRYLFVGEGFPEHSSVPGIVLNPEYIKISNAPHPQSSEKQTGVPLKLYNLQCCRKTPNICNKK